MPRPKKEGAVPKTRSRNGCWPCKARKIKCDESRPYCEACARADEADKCDYRVRLNWSGRGQKAADASPWSHEHITIVATKPRSTSISSSIVSASTRPSLPTRAPSPSPLAQCSAQSDSSMSHGTKRKRNHTPGTERALQYQDENGSPLENHPGLPSPTSSESSRRLSVPFLQQSPYETDNHTHSPDPRGRADMVSYGFDQGFPDLDVPHNDDANALVLQSPSLATRRLDLAGDEFQFNVLQTDGARDPKFRRAEYYARPVPVRIPRSLQPLPQMLLDDPMNLLYFHHFLNHTAEVLVPHDCPENPFKNILPQMAVCNDNLLHLLLAYAASHRSRLLSHREPVNRIAHLVKEVFPSLRAALENGDEAISDANLATAIMLTSLEIISPSVFEVPVSWQTHLTIARQMIVARGGFSTLERDGKAAHFLSRWFAYLDVIGSLSGSNHDRPLHRFYGAHDCSDPDGDSEIDCLLGLTNRCITSLARVADLAKQCDGQRIGPGGVVRQTWQPAQDVISQAELLQHELQEARRPAALRRCAHGQPDTTQSATTDSLEMMAVNESYHWAGLIHLQRRVLNKPSSDEAVQTAVREIAAALDRIRHGGAAEGTMIFALFTAGCEAIGPDMRLKFLDRTNSVECFGLAQVQSARILMQRVWSTGRPWETLAAGEFFG